MPVYRYKARNSDKYIITDIVEAVDRGDAVRKIKNINLVPLDVYELKVGSLLKNKDLTITSGVSKQDLVFFLSQFYNLLEAGLTIIDSLKIIIDQTDNKYLRKYVIQILQDLRNGSSLYRSMSKHRRVFPKLMIEMIRVGEVIGKVKEVTYDLYIYYKKQTKNASEIRSALIYPLFLLVAAFLVTLFLLIVVIPQFEDIFRGLDRELPAITRLVLSSSHFVQNHFILIILMIILIVISIISFNRSKQGKMFFSHLSLRMPIFGKINRKGYLIKISRTYSTLLNNSINAIESLEITKNIMANEIYKELIDRAMLNVQNGVPISKAFEKQWYVAPVFSSMMLGSIADYYDNEMDSEVTRLQKLMEPMVILVLVGIVGILVLSIIIPMFSMLEQ